MFRRVFWFGAGAAAGVWATTKVHRKLRSLAPDSLAARAAERALEAGGRLREFTFDIRAGMAQREDELNDALGLAAPPGPDRDTERRGIPGRPHHRGLGTTRPYDRNEDY